MFAIYEFNWIWIHIWKPNCMTDQLVSVLRTSLHQRQRSLNNQLSVWSPR